MTDSEIIAQLTPLSPFKKYHYSSHLINSNGLLEPARKPLLEQVVRLTRTFPISVEWPQDKQFALALELCPKYNAVVNLDSSPWQNMMLAHKPADSWGSEFVKDITAMVNNLSKIKTALGALVPKVAMVDAEEWNVFDDNKEALDAKHNIVLSVFKENFPTTDTIIYDRGGVNYDNDKGWSNNEHGLTTLNEPGDYFCCNCYFMTELSLMEEVIRRNIAAAKVKGMKRVIPWVTLGASGYRKGLSIYQWDATKSPTIDYDLQNDWRLGAALNQAWCWEFPGRFFDGNFIDYVCHWPGLFTFPLFDKHFVAYAKGANLKEL